MAEVFLAHATQGEKRPVVVKAMHAHLAADPLYRSMFTREARLCSRLDHPGIVPLVDFFATHDGLFLVFEFIDGLDLRRVLKTCAARRIPIPFEVAAFIAAHLLEALDYAHTLTIGGAPAGIVHRDVSPANVILSWRGHVKLADFGVAQVVGHVPEREKSLLTGKFGYMSPEQVRGEALDGRSDVFSAGVVLAELLMVKRLFLEESIADLLVAVDHVKLDRLNDHASVIPVGLHAVLLRALARDTSIRFATAADFRDALLEWLARGKTRAGAAPLAAFLAEIRPLLVPG